VYAQYFFDTFDTQEVFILNVRAETGDVMLLIPIGQGKGGEPKQGMRVLLSPSMKTKINTA